ncbi:MAG: hypothetical protein J6V70_04570, partial [Kiritimatiellae bacterium]|nr:hypothetical protein [Kiritimatiellia bacterium]
MPKTELWNQMRDFITEQDRRINSDQDLLPLPDFVPQWREQAEYELEKINYERKFDPWTDAQKSKILELADRGAQIPRPYV